MGNRLSLGNHILHFILVLALTVYNCTSQVNGMVTSGTQNSYKTSDLHYISVVWDSRGQTHVPAAAPPRVSPSLDMPMAQLNPAVCAVPP